MDGKKINFGKFETAAFLANVFIIKIFLGLPGELVRSTGCSAWLAALFSGIIFLGVLFLIFKFCNIEGDILKPSEKLWQKALKVVFGVILSVSFLVKGALALRVACEITVSVLPLELPLNLCIFMLSLGMGFAACFGLESVVRLHAVFVPLIVLGFAFSVLASVSSWDITNLFPVLGAGEEQLLKSSLKHVGIYSDIIYIFLLAPYVKSKRVFKKACFYGTLAAEAVIFGTVLSFCLSVEYGVGAKLFMPIYQLSRFIKSGGSMQGLEAFLLPEWVISSLLYASSTAYFAAESFKKTFCLKNRRIFVLSASFFVFLLALVPKNLNEASAIGLKAVNPLVVFVSLAAVLAKIKTGRKLR